MSFDIDEMDQVICPFCGAMFDTILADVVECPCCCASIELSTEKPVDNITCAWCGKALGYDPRISGTSHGMYQECYEKLGINSE